jgi:hypothetical protein
MRYVLGLLLGIGLIVLVFILILRAFGGNPSKVEVELTDYAVTDTVMRLTVEGQVNVDQDHRLAKVIIGRSQNTMQLVQGYQNKVIKTREYASNEAAYTTFLRALDLQGYTRGNDDPRLEDSRGVCPTGTVYTFEIITGSSIVQSYWTTSCGGGTFEGNSAVIRRLFRVEIPEYFQVIRNTGLN